VSDSLNALRRANPRARAGFAESVEAAGALVRARLAAPAPVAHRTRARRHRARMPLAAVAVAFVAAVAAVVVGASPGSRPGVDNAVAAVKRAATLSAASAERSGTATVRVVHDGRLWSGTTVRWSGDDLSIRSDTPGRDGHAGSAMLVVDGTVYATDPRLGWVAQGSPSNIDPDGGTTPSETLAAARADVGGDTMRRITAAMTGLSTRRSPNGSVVYTGTVAAGVIAPETDVKEGRTIRVLPFGIVAHDQAEDADAPLRTAVTVGPGGIVREIAATWGTWSYTVTYGGLGSTPAPTAPEHAVSLQKLREARAGAALRGD
jgi:hypothetical protein